MKGILRTIICAGFATAMLASCEKELPHRHVTPIDAPAEISLSIEGVNETIGLMAPKTRAFPITIKANTIADQLLTFTVAPNPDKVADYNKANGTDYEMVPGDAYELSTKVSSVIICFGGIMAKTRNLMISSDKVNRMPFPFMGMITPIILPNFRNRR